MMQMLARGGMPILTDGLREADPDNPRGYYEWEPVKRLPQEPNRVAEAEGQAVKIITALLFSLPSQFTYRVIFMQRPLSEVVRSQAEMIRRLGTAAPQVPAQTMIGALQASLNQVTAWLERQPMIEVCWIDYHQLLEAPVVHAEKIQRFLGVPLNTAAMA
ncbi:MAG: sulfotransferase family protein, partial [Thermoplasmata archaeon]|nr:sulfotransferase family protein [Thermoplasmata archaeon]